MSSIDLIVPCYNYGRFLGQCVDSILLQADVDLKVLIIDDASSDDTPEVATALVARDSRVQYRRHDVNRGNIATYNEGLDWASADYMLLISADDMLFPGALKRAARLMDAHPEVGLVFGRVVTYLSGEPLPKPGPDLGETGQKVLTGLEWLVDVCKAQGDPITTPDAIVRTAMQKEVGGYRDDLPHSGDIEMFIRFALRGSIGILDADQAIYRKHGANMHLGRDWHAMNLAKDRMNAFREAFAKFGHGTKEEKRLEQIAYDCIVQAILWRECQSFDKNHLEVPISEVLDFAVRTSPHALALREYWALRSRQICGSRLWPAVQRLARRRRKALAS